MKIVRSKAGVYLELLRSGEFIVARSVYGPYSVRLVERAGPSGSTST
jgi:hypothetical protein